MEPPGNPERFTYANICEQCDNFIPDPDRHHVIAQQLADVITLRNDAATRNWPDEADRHSRVADALTSHLQRIEKRPTRTRELDLPPRAG